MGDNEVNVYPRDMDCCEILEKMGWERRYTRTSATSGKCDGGIDWCQERTPLPMKAGGFVSTTYLLMAVGIPKLWMFIFALPLMVFGRRIGLAHHDGQTRLVIVKPGKHD